MTDAVDSPSQVLPKLSGSPWHIPKLTIDPVRDMRSILHTVVRPLVALLSLAACGGGNDSVGTPPQPQSPVVATVAVTAASTTPLLPGGTVQLSAKALTAGGAEIPSATFSWSSATPNVATVSSTGLVTAVTPGSSIITASAGAASGSVNVQVNPAPVAPAITTQPASQSVLLGAAVTLSVSVSGTAPFTYQWKRNGVDVAGATNSTLTITQVAKSDTNAIFTVAVRNDVGTTLSTAATLTVNWAPQITIQPISRTVSEWDSISIAAAADARPAATYQWRLNGTNISGATGPSYRIESASLTTSAGRYSVVVSNNHGSVTSSEAAITVQRPTPSSFQWRGFNFSSFGSNYWASSSDNEAALQFAKSRGANLIVLDWMVEFNDDGTMALAGGPSHEAWINIQQVIARAKAMGFLVALKPHAISTTCCGQNRALFNTDTTKFIAGNFFPGWQAYLMDMMNRLPMSSVDVLVIGTEMDIFDWRERSRWSTLIATVRARFSGQLTYDAMFAQYPGAKDLDDVVFWDLLDFISTSLYVRLTTDDNASLETLIQLFRNNSAVQEKDAIGYLRRVSARVGKPIMAMEGGYQSANGALWGVNDYFNSGFNEDLQVRGLDAYLTALNVAKQSWLRGVSLWDIQPRHFQPNTLQDPNYRAGWGMANKLSAEVVRRWFSVP